MVAEVKVERLRNVQLKSGAKWVGYGSSCMGASGRLCRRCALASTAGCGNWNGMLKAELRLRSAGGLRKCDAEERGSRNEYGDLSSLIL